MPNKPDIIDQLEGFPYGREMQDNLIATVVALTNKKSPPINYTFRLREHSGIFVDYADLGEMLNVASTHLMGEFLSADELETKLIASYHPDIPEAAYNIAARYAERPRDHLTGFHQKDQVPRIMGTATLQAQASGRPVTVTDFDFSNMRGTNEHWEKVLACVMQTEITPEIRQEAMKLTDRAAHIISSITYAVFHTELQENGQTDVEAVRTGGDEVRLVSGADAEFCEVICKKAENKSEQATALMGLHDHTHLKRPLDPWSKGFGGAGASFPLQADGHFEDHVKNADIRIQNRKIEIGQNRLEDDMLQKMKPPYSNDPDLYTDPKKAAFYLEAALTNMEELEVSLGQSPQPDRIATELDRLATSNQSGHLLTITEIHNHFKGNLANDLAEADINLTRQELKALSIKATRFPAIDYATNTILATDMPAMAGAALRSITSINKQAGIEAEPWVMGISLHNIAGLNGALGHENASAVMHHIVNEIIRPSLHSYSIADENFLISHIGGGEFRLIIQPIIPGDLDKHHIIDQKTINAITNDIETDIGQLNLMPVGYVLDRQKMPIDEIMKQNAFYTIQNPRPEVSPREDGLIATVVTARHTTKGNDPANNRGGAAVHFIGELLSDEVKTRRQGNEPIHSDFITTRDDTMNLTLF